MELAGAAGAPAKPDAKTILIVDDTPANLGVVSSHLERHGYCALVALGGEEAIARAEYVRPDLILLDVVMPGLDGFETCRRLKALDGTRDIPVIFMTALGDTSDKVAGFAAGAVDYMTKPLDGAEVLARIETHLALYTLRRQLASRNAQLQQEIAARQKEIAARQEMQTALERSNAELEQLAYVASHDMQEPLRMIASYLQLVAQRYQGRLDAEADEFIGYAVDGAKRMQALIADLLEFSRLGRTTGSFVPCDLAAIAQDVRDELAEDLRGATVTVGPLPTLLGDPTLYRALLQNLIGNAIKYRRGTDPPTIALTAVRDGETWTFSCADRGIGIEPAYRDRVFAIFQRLHGRGEFDGTGIGLALCKKIVEFCGGRIWIDEPDDGIGTVVRWTLPALPTGPGLAAPELDGPDEHDEHPPRSDAPAPPSTPTPPVSTAPSPQPTSGTR
jgi:two-component system sensor histidine kinase/response regulator